MIDGDRFAILYGGTKSDLMRMRYEGKSINSQNFVETVVSSMYNDAQDQLDEFSKDSLKYSLEEYRGKRNRLYSRAHGIGNIREKDVDSIISTLGLGENFPSDLFSDKYSSVKTLVAVKAKEYIRDEHRRYADIVKDFEPSDFINNLCNYAKAYVDYADDGDQAKFEGALAASPGYDSEAVYYMETAIKRFTDDYELDVDDMKYVLSHVTPEDIDRAVDIACDLTVMTNKYDSTGGNTYFDSLSRCHTLYDMSTDCFCDMIDSVYHNCLDEYQKEQRTVNKHSGKRVFPSISSEIAVAAETVPKTVNNSHVDRSVDIPDAPTIDIDAPDF